MYTTNDEIRQTFDDCCDEQPILFENPSYCTAFIGRSNDGRAIYDYELMIFYLIENEKMTWEDAVEFIDFNTIQTLGFEGSPIVLFKD